MNQFHEIREMQCGGYTLNLKTPLVMGIVNVTPDSFSGDGCSAADAINHAREQLEAGADILDVGAESSRPGSEPVPLEEELTRLKPILSEVLRWGVPISVDTYKPQVMRWAADLGVAIINDIAALRLPGSMEAVSGHDCSICLMHMQGEPRNMQLDPQYQDVSTEVWDFLAQRVNACESAGIHRSRLILDPGFGFGKSLKHNCELFQSMNQRPLGYLPLLVGVSRKRMLGEITGSPIDERLLPSVVAAVMAAEQGARILRVHDVAATCEGLAVWSALRRPIEPIENKI